MATRAFQIGTFTALSLVLLRVGLGWFFFAGAWEKHHSGKFTSEPFLKAAKGPLAPLYQANLPDVHGFRELVEKPRQQTPLDQELRDLQQKLDALREQLYKASQLVAKEPLPVKPDPDKQAVKVAEAEQRLVKILPGAIEQEKQVHSALSELRTRNIWPDEVKASLDRAAGATEAAAAMTKDNASAVAEQAKGALDEARAQVLLAGPYGAWQNRIIEDWGRDQQFIAAHFGFDDQQKQQAGRLLRVYEGKLRGFLDQKAGDLAGFRHDLHRMLGKKAEPELPVDAEMDQRRGSAAAVRKWVADTGDKFRDELKDLVNDAQRRSYGALPVEKSSLASFDRFLIYTHMAIGFCLLVGLLTRLAALGAATFLMSVIASQPPWVAESLPWNNGPQAVMYQVVLMLACIVLMTSGAGRWAGLDYFFRRRSAES